MAELTKEELDRVNEIQYMEDEFGLGLKGYLIVRAIFYCIGTFMILGALLALVCGTTTMNDLVSNATALKGTSPLLNDCFDGFKLCMYVQAVYTVASLVTVILFYIKRTKIFAFIDLGLFVVFAVIFFIMGSFEIFTTIGGGFSAWPLYFLLNPVFSFIALFVGKHFPYMPMK